MAYKPLTTAELIRSVGDRIVALRKKHGYSADGLAKMANIAQSTVSRYENGERQHMDINTLAKIADVLGVSVDYLIGRVDNPQS